MSKVKSLGIKAFPAKVVETRQITDDNGKVFEITVTADSTYEIEMIMNSARMAIDKMTGWHER